MFLTSTKKVIRKFQQTNVRVCVQFVGVGLYIYCCTIALNCCNHKRLKFQRCQSYVSRTVCLLSSR